MDYVQVMLMVDVEKDDDAFRGALVLAAQGETTEWRFYDAQLFDDLDHMKRFLCGWIKEKYGVDSFMMMLCKVESSGMVNTVDPAQTNSTGAATPQRWLRVSPRCRQLACTARQSISHASRQSL